MIVVCPECGAKNRVPDPPEPGKEYRCGKCKTKLLYITKKRWHGLKSVKESWMKPPIIHPLLLAVFPILALYSQNMDKLTFSDTFVTLALSPGITLLVLLILWLKFRNAKKIGVIVSIYLILFFSYGLIVEPMEGWGMLFANRLMLALWTIFLVIAVYVVVRTRRDLHNMTVILNSMAVCLVVIPLIYIVIHEIGRPSLSPTHEPLIIASDSKENENLPDIYYIILDGYGSSNNLDRYFGFDNSEFTQSLSDRGFFVATESKSNYRTTIHSITSSLNMEYINYLADELGEHTTDERPLWQMCQNHKVWQYLKTKGYKYVHLESYWKLTGRNAYADISFLAFPANEFTRLVVQTTWLRAIPDITDIIFGLSVGNRQMHWKCAMTQFEHLDNVTEMNDIKRPIFVFVHVVIPHRPFVFEQDGGFITIETESSRSEGENYINQLTFCNNRILKIIDNILSESAVPPVIILQADHGPKFVGLSDYGSLSINDQIEINFGILNAYYLPGDRAALLYDSITPVNTFRLIFNTYFGEDYELLSDNSYFSTLDHPYIFQSLEDAFKK